MTTHTNEEFNNLVVERFGDKVVVDIIHAPDDALSQINSHYNLSLTQKDFDDYGARPWLMDTKCPNCGMDLGGLIGSFEWGIRHGVGYCSACKQVELQLYHYIGDPSYRFECFSVFSFSDEEENETEES